MRSRVFAPLCIGLLVLGCGTDDGVVVVNQPPTIRFDFIPVGVGKSTLQDLAVTVSDPDEDDVLTVSWEITRGSLTPIDASQIRRRWTVPATIGVDTLRVSVSDGEDSASIVEEIRVGTRLAVETLDGSYPVVNSPYILALPAAASGTTIRVTGALTLQEGVEILFDVPGGTLSLEGGAVFSSQGTADNPIVIRPNDRTLRCQNGRGWWVGVLATGTSRIVFDHTAISYGERNINLRESSSAVLTNSDFKCSSEASVEIASGGSLVMDNCEVTNNASVGVGVRSQTSITPDSVVITNSNISINGNMGIRMELRDAAMASGIRVEMNRLEFNFTHGVYLTNQVFPKIHNNHFESNGLSGGLSNLRLQPPYPAGVPFDTLDATSNYWGGSFTNQADVDATIHDSLDDAGIGTRIKTNPWLNQSPLP